MDILSAISHARLHPREKIFWREKWLSPGANCSIDGEIDYTVPSYIFFDSDREEFIAVFGSSEWAENYSGPTVMEDFMNGVVVSHWSTEDVLATDWRVAEHDGSIFKSKRRADQNP